MCTVLLYGEIIGFTRLIIIPLAFHIPCRIGDIAERQLHILCSCESQCGRFCGLEIGVLASTLYGKFPLVTADGDTLAIGKEILKYRLFCQRHCDIHLIAIHREYTAGIIAAIAGNCISVAAIGQTAACTITGIYRLTVGFDGHCRIRRDPCGARDIKRHGIGRRFGQRHRLCHICSNIDRFRNSVIPISRHRVGILTCRNDVYTIRTFKFCACAVLQCNDRISLFRLRCQLHLIQGRNCEILELDIVIT